MAEISIVVPVYNALPYLPACVEGVLSQRYKNWELLLVDDGSTDGSGEMCDDYAQNDSRIHAFHLPHGGPSAARNCGLYKASGTYLLFLDSDDFYVDETVLKALYQTAEEVQSDVLCFDYVRYPSRSGSISDAVIHYMPPNKLETDVEQMTRNNAYQSSCCIKMLCLSFIKAEGLYFTEKGVGEDILFSARLLLCAKTIAFLPLAGYVYRITQGSRSRAYSIETADALLSIIENLCKTPNIPDGKRKVFYEYLAFQYCTLLINWRAGGSSNKLGQSLRIRQLGWLLRYDACRTVHLVKLAASFLGIRMTSWLLCWYFRWKRGALE